MTPLKLFLLLVVIIVYTFSISLNKNEEHLSKFEEACAMTGILCLIATFPTLIVMIFYYIKI